MNIERLKPGTYQKPGIPARVKYFLRKNGILVGFLVLALLALGITIATAGFTEGVLALLGLVILPSVLIGVWAIYHHGLKYFRASYQVSGITFEFESLEYFVPEDVMIPFVEGIFKEFQPVIDFDPETMFRGVRVVVMGDRPYDPLERVPRSEMVGLTFPGIQRTTYIYGPYALNRGGLGYELKLHACEFLFPGRDEGDDIEWMKANNLLP